MLTMGSIICLLLLVSISYQPLVADEPIKQINKINETIIINKEFLERYNRFIELKSQFNDDCECDRTPDWGYPIICLSLFAYLKVLMFIYEFLQLFSIFYPLFYLFFIFLYRTMSTFEDIWETFNCYWLYDP